METTPIMIAVMISGNSCTNEAVKKYQNSRKATKPFLCANKANIFVKVNKSELKAQVLEKAGVRALF